MRSAITNCLLCTDLDARRTMCLRACLLLAIVALVSIDGTPARAEAPANAAGKTVSWLNDHQVTADSPGVAMRCVEYAWRHRAITFGVLGTLPFAMIVGFWWHDRNKHAEERRPAIKNFTRTPAKENTELAA